MAKNLENAWMDTSRTYAKCPKCGTGYLDTRVPRGFFVKHVLFWLDVKRYKCNNCGNKVYLNNKK